MEKNDSLIGGFIIKVGNKEYDWSLAGRCKAAYTKIGYEVIRFEFNKFRRYYLHTEK